MQKFDYIIAGAGCAGLSLAFYISISKAENLKNKKILLIDKVPKTTNDRTWSFWKDKNIPFEFEEIIHKKWENIYFFGENFSDKINISPYNYNTIRAIDFYDFTQKIISQNPNIQVVYEEIQEIGEANNYAFVRTNTSTDTHTSTLTGTQVYEADFVFNSTNFFYDTEKKAGYHYFLQHFKGFIVETKTDFFDEKTAHFMDFRVAQVPKEARFCYILPFSPTKALIEFTVFSENLLEQKDNNEYDTQLKNYIENIIQLSDYQVVEEEFGVIPMYDFEHKKQVGNRIINIGTTGGQVKASTGYAFLRIQARTRAITNALSATGKPFYKEKNTRKYQIYDSALLRVMANDKGNNDGNNSLSMKKIFTILFEKLPISGLFRFLDEKSTFLEDVKLMSKVPPMPFIKAILNNFWKQKI